MVSPWVFSPPLFHLTYVFGLSPSHARKCRAEINCHHKASFTRKGRHAQQIWLSSGELADLLKSRADCYCLGGWLWSQACLEVKGILESEKAGGIQ